jgi:hypothetical protein
MSPSNIDLVSTITAVGFGDWTTADGQGGKVLDEISHRISRLLILVSAFYC